MRAMLLAASLLATSAAGCIVQADPVAEQQFANSIPGRYVGEMNGQPLELLLQPDGTGSLNGQPGQWTVSMGQLMLSDGQQWAPASLESGVLTVQLPEGPVSFQRQDVGPAPGAPAVAGDPAAVDPAVAAAPPAPAAGGLDRRLIGCWQDYSNSGSQNGAGAFDSKIQFASDGTYARRTVVSVSAGELSSTSEDGEAGTWAIEGADLVLRPQAAPAIRRGFTLDGGILFLGGAKHLPCS